MNNKGKKISLDQIKAALMGLGEIQRAIDELYRVRLPPSWEKPVLLLEEEPFRVCFWRPGELRVVPLPAWSWFEKHEGPMFVAKSEDITFDNTVVSPAKDIKTEKGGNGYRWCLSEGLVTLARIDMYKKVFVRPNRYWVDIWDAQRRQQWLESLWRTLS